MTVDLEELERLADMPVTKFKSTIGLVPLEPDTVRALARELRAYRTVCKDQPYLQDRVRREMGR